jgi:hypothetical protein
MIKVYFKLDSYKKHTFSNLWNQEEKIFVIDFIKGWFGSKERLVERKITKGELLDINNGTPYNGYYRQVIFKNKVVRLNYSRHSKPFYSNNNFMIEAKLPV